MRLPLEVAFQVGSLENKPQGIIQEDFRKKDVYLISRKINFWKYLKISTGPLSVI